MNLCEVETLKHLYQFDVKWQKLEPRIKNEKHRRITGKTPFSSSLYRCNLGHELYRHILWLKGFFTIPIISDALRTCCIAMGIFSSEA